MTREQLLCKHKWSRFDYCLNCMATESEVERWHEKARAKPEDMQLKFDNSLEPLDKRTDYDMGLPHWYVGWNPEHQLVPDQPFKSNGQ